MPIKVVGKASTFGGPMDDPSHGNDRPDWKEEGLALFPEQSIPEEFRNRFLESDAIEDLIKQGLTGRARHLNPMGFYGAMRWEEHYSEYGKPEFREWLRKQIVPVRNKRTGKTRTFSPVDHGPGTGTERVLDISPGAMLMLKGEADDEVEVTLPDYRTGDAPLDDRAYEYVDPRDADHPGQNPRKEVGNKTGGTSMFGNLLKNVVLPLALSFLFTSGKGIISGLFRKYFDVAQGVEVPGVPGPKKEDAAILVLRPLWEKLGRFLIQLAVNTLNQVFTKTWPLEESKSSGISLFDKFLNRK